MKKCLHSDAIAQCVSIVVRYDLTLYFSTIAAQNVVSLCSMSTTSLLLLLLLLLVLFRVEGAMEGYHAALLLLSLVIVQKTGVP